MDKIEYSIETQQVTVQNLIICNEEDNDKLLKVVLNGELFKIIILKRWEKKVLSLHSGMVDEVEILEIV